MAKKSSASLSEPYEKYLPFLLEVRKRLMFVVGVFLVSSIIGFLYYEKIVVFVLSFLNLEGVNVVFTSPFQFFTLSVNSGFVVGLVVVLPLIISQILSFVRPALQPKEYKLILMSLPLTIILFITGFAFGVSVMKYLVAIFYQKSVELQIGNILDIELLLSKIMVTGALMGIAFQFPIVMTILLRLKVIKYKLFVQQRSIFYLTSVFFVLLLPPTDLMSDLFLTLPLVILFELTLILNKLVLKSHLL
jgi:sec-independent protein translocase protein TatC